MFIKENYSHELDGCVPKWILSDGESCDGMKDFFIHAIFFRKTSLKEITQCHENKKKIKYFKKIKKVLD